MTWGAVLVLVVASMSCTKSADRTIDPRSVEEVVRALRETSQQPSARIVGTLRVSAYRSVRSDFTGVMDFDNGNASFTANSSVDGTSRRIGLKMLVVDGKAYGRRSGRGAGWVEFSLPEARRLTGPDPKDFMVFSSEEVRSAEDLGEEAVRGVDTRHYSLEIGVGPDSEDVLLQGIAAAGVDSVPVDVWVDEQGLVNTLSLLLELEDVSFELTSTYADFGIPVKLKPPARDQVRQGTLTDLLR